MIYIGPYYSIAYKKRCMLILDMYLYLWAAVRVICLCMHEYEHVFITFAHLATLA